jgi:hypothetical protein
MILTARRASKSKLPARRASHYHEECNPLNGGPVDQDAVAPGIAEKTHGHNGFAAPALIVEKSRISGTITAPCAFTGVVCWDVRPAVCWEGQVGILLRPVWASQGGTFAQRPISHATARTTRRCECREAGSTGLKSVSTRTRRFGKQRDPIQQPLSNLGCEGAPLAAPVEIGRIEFAFRFAVHSALDVSRG